MTILKCLVSFSFLLFGQITMGAHLGFASEPVAVHHKATAKSDELIRDVMAKRRIPGMAVLVTFHGKEVYGRFLGMADLENQIDVRRDTYFRFASVSKAITAVVAMKMVERGEINLDAPLGDYWLGACPSMQGMTLRSLLSHQSGLRHYQDTAWSGPLKHYRSLQARIDDVADDLPLSKVGERFSYSTFGYVVAGRAMEVACETTFMQMVKEQVMEPAGMKAIQPDDIYSITPHRSRGYFIGFDNQRRNSVPFDASGLLPGGGLGGTIEDLAAFGTAVVNDELLRPDSLAKMWEVQTLSNGTPTEYALGWHVRADKQGRYVFHTGSQPGVSSLILLKPDEHCSIAILANLEQVNLTPLGKRLLDAWKSP